MPPLSKQIHERYIIIRYSTKKQKRREPTGYSLIRASPENRKKKQLPRNLFGRSKIPSPPTLM